MSVLTSTWHTAVEAVRGSRAKYQSGHIAPTVGIAKGMAQANIVSGVPFAITHSPSYMFITDVLYHS